MKEAMSRAQPGRIARNSNLATLLRLAVSALFFLFGVFAGPLLDPHVEPLMTTTTMVRTTFIIVVVAVTVIAAIWYDIRNQMMWLAEDANAVARAVGQRVRIISHSEGYEEVRRRIQEASFEVRKLVVYDLKDDGMPAYSRELLDSEARRKTYEAEREKIEAEKGNGTFRYVDIVQIQRGSTIAEIAVHDKVFGDHVKYVAGVSRAAPEVAAIKVAGQVFADTFILIDREFLYVAFRTRDEPDSVFQYPFISFAVHDPNSEVIHEMVRLHERIEAGADIVTSVD